MTNDAEQATDADAADEQAAEGADGDEQTVEDATLAARVREHDDALADEVADLEARVAELEADLDEANEEGDDLTERLQTKQADFQNYKQRAKRRQEELKERATEDLVERLLDVRDNLDRALEEDSDDAEGLREGVELTRNEFDRVLESEGVREIAPEPGADVDAQRHEVMMRVDADQPDGAVAELYRPGYEMGGRVLRTAQVTVSDGDEDGDE